MEPEEKWLPSTILAKAIRSGNEFGWKKNDFIEAVLAAKSVELGITGWQIQFVLPDATCEPHWLTYNTNERQPGEKWQHYCERTANECIDEFQKLLATTDLVKEGIKSFELLKTQYESGVEIEEFLVFLLNFNDHETWLKEE